jgi:hypothetical protein
MAGNRVGKTYGCCAETAMHATGIYPNSWNGYRYTKKNLSIWVMAIDHGSLKHMINRLFVGASNDPPFISTKLVRGRRINADGGFAVPEDRRILVQNSRGGISTIRFLTYDGGKEKDNKMSGHKGEHVDFIYIDEQPSYSAYSEAVVRLANVTADDHGMMVIAATCLNYTPFVLDFTERVEHVTRELEGGTSFIETVQVHIDAGDIVDGKVYYNFGWDEVKHLDGDQKKILYKNIPLHERTARTTGIPMVGSGLVYPVAQEALICAPMAIPDHWALIGGADYGWNNTAFLLGAHDRDSDTLYIYWEHQDGKRTPAEHSSIIRQMPQAAALFQVNVMADPAGSASTLTDGTQIVNLYRDQGLIVVNADNRKEYGIQKVLHRMQTGRLKIFSTCTKLLSCLLVYARDKEGLAIKSNDHLPDCLRYIITGLGYAVTLAEISNNNY